MAGQRSLERNTQESNKPPISAPTHSKMWEQSRNELNRPAAFCIMLKEGLVFQLIQPLIPRDILYKIGIHTVKMWKLL